MCWTASRWACQKLSQISCVELLVQADAVLGSIQALQTVPTRLHWYSELLGTSIVAVLQAQLLLLGVCCLTWLHVG